MTYRSMRDHFPGARGDWARFDGPAGTQMVDVAIQAMADFAGSGANANTGGAFAAADACDALLERARATVGQLLGADPGGICFGANMTTMTMAFTRAVGRTLRPGDRVVGTRLDHDANVAPWRIACDDAGAEHVLAGFDPSTGVLDPQAVIDLIDERTRWVAVTGRVEPDRHDPRSPADHSTPPTTSEPECSSTQCTFAPHRRIDVRALGVDVLATSPYKWYGPHAGVVRRSELLDALPIAKVRPAAHTGSAPRWARAPRTLRASPPSRRPLASSSRKGWTALAADEAVVFRPLLDGLQSLHGVRLWGPATLEGRTPTAAFTIAGRTPGRDRRGAGGREDRHVGRPQLRRRSGRSARTRRIGRRRAGGSGPLRRTGRRDPPARRGRTAGGSDPLNDLLVELDRLPRRLELQFPLEQLGAQPVLPGRQHRLTGGAVGAHDPPVRRFVERIAGEHPLRGGDGEVELTELDEDVAEAGSHVVVLAAQTLALRHRPLLVREVLHEVADVERLRIEARLCCTLEVTVALEVVRQTGGRVEAGDVTPEIDVAVERVALVIAGDPRGIEPTRPQAATERVHGLMEVALAG